MKRLALLGAAVLTVSLVSGYSRYLRAEESQEGYWMSGWSDDPCFSRCDQWHSWCHCYHLPDIIIH